MRADEIANSVKKEVAQEFRRIDQRRQAVFSRYPLLLGVLATTGMVCIFGSISRIIEQVDWLYRNPWILFLFGIVLLFTTGTIYKKLS